MTDIKPPIATNGSAHLRLCSVVSTLVTIVRSLPGYQPKLYVMMDTLRGRMAKKERLEWQALCRWSVARGCLSETCAVS